MTPPPETARDQSAGPLFGIYLLALGICLGGNLAIRLGERGGWLSQRGQLLVAVLSAIPLAVAVAWFWRMLARSLDERLQRIVLEGMALALIIFIPLAALYVNLRTAGAWTPRLDPPDLLLAPALLVALGIAIAWRRYS